MELYWFSQVLSPSMFFFNFIQNDRAAHFTAVNINNIKNYIQIYKLFTENFMQFQK